MHFIAPTVSLRIQSGNLGASQGVPSPALSLTQKPQSTVGWALLSCHHHRVVSNPGTTTGVSEHLRHRHQQTQRDRQAELAGGPLFEELVPCLWSPPGRPSTQSIP